MKKTILISIISVVSLLVPQLNISAAQIGSWKAYMAYHDITEVEQAGNIIYVLASNNLFSLNTTDNSVQTYDKVNALSDCNIAHISWCSSAQRLVIIYKNENIDLLNTNGTTVNISDYYSKSMTEDKTINSINIDGNYAYLSTSFGIIKLNVKDAEISDTYNLGFNVNYSYISNGKLYAASSSNGLYAASTNTNMLDKSNWSRIGDYVAQNKTIDDTLLAKAKGANPGGPKYNYFGFLKYANNQLYSCGGTIGGMRKATIQIMKDGEWTIYQDEGISDVSGATYQDIVCLDYDPKDITHVFAGGRTGMYEFKDGKFIKYYSNDNSPLETASTVGNNNKEYVLVTGLKFDTSGNLWCLNSIAPNKSLLEYTKDGQWADHGKTDFMVYSNRSMENMVSPMFDSRGLLWFVNDFFRTPALLCYNITTDVSKCYSTFVNEDGTTVGISDGVRCVAEDLDNNIWIGTNVGPMVLESSQISNGTEVFTQVKVPRNDGTNYADYLLSGVDISCIAIDGGNRKWFGTKSNGVYLISSDNLSQIHHFTSSNSSLLSDVVEAIAINGTTGEVFIGTDKGLCSYMSDATTPSEEMKKDEVYAYPNPVKPDYTGLITVVGLSYNADVKITTSNGILVAEGQSNGGTFTWDGCDKKGKRVASGVYMVMTATSDGSKGTVCKIAIVR
jgi:hypothetical protein